MGRLIRYSSIFIMLCVISALVSASIELPIPQGLCTTFRWQYGAESAQQAAKLLDYPCHHNWIADSYGVQGHTKTGYTLQPSYLDQYANNANNNEFWLIGSEPNLGITYIKPSDAAIFTNGWIARTNTIWACCGTLQHIEYFSLNWLDEYLASGGIVPDVWHIHIYFVDNQGWDATVNQFRNWMITNDVVRPIIISETGQTGSDAEPLLRHVAEAVCNKDVQAVYWYIGDKDFHGFAPSSQLTIDGQITELGKLFIELQTCPPIEPPKQKIRLPIIHQ